MERLKQGIRRYRENVFPQQRELLEKLAREGQKPHTLVIACSDSRIKVSEWTQADPGEFFVVRNAGNIIAPPDSPPNGVAASIEYAVKCLPIRNVIIAGHSHCGAVSALFDARLLESLAQVAPWLQHALKARERAEELVPELDVERRVHSAIKENVLLQLEHLRAYPCIQAGVGAGQLELHAWMLEFEAGLTWVHDEATGAWSRLE
jgi:carbonic anhydrase